MKKTITDIHHIDTTTETGQLLSAALVKLTTESQRDKTPGEVVQQCQALRAEMYGGEKDGGAFERDLSELLNKHSRENKSNTPDFVLAAYLIETLKAFENANNAREAFYGKSLTPGVNNQ